MLFYNHISHPSQNIIRVMIIITHIIIYLFFNGIINHILKQQGSIEIDIDIEVAPFPLITVLLLWPSLISITQVLKFSL